MRLVVVGGKVGWRLVGDTWRIGHWVGSPQPSPPGLDLGREGGEWRLGRDEEDRVGRQTVSR